MHKLSSIFVAGGRGMVGTSICRHLKSLGYVNVTSPTRPEVNLLDTASVNEFYATTKPEYVFFAAAKVGGILANSELPYNFLFDNLQIQNNVINGAFKSGVKKLLFLGSSCIYPKLAPQPLKEEYLLSGPLEPSNEWYAIAKIAGIKLCQAIRQQHGANFISAMPCNLYGPNDNYDASYGHVLPALIRKFHEAKQGGKPEVACWGTGSPLREFLYVDDLAEACVKLMLEYNESQFINVGSGIETSIKDLASMVAQVVGYRGAIAWDSAKPDGTPRKIMDNTRISSLGWFPKTSLAHGIFHAYVDFKAKWPIE